MVPETASASSTTQTLTGCVKWFNNGLNYGFITVLSDGDYRNTDIFVHQSNIRTAKECFRTLYTGECVQFELANSDNEKHPIHAVNVRGFNGVQLRCEVPRGNGFGRIGGSGNGRGRGGGGGRGRGNGRSNGRSGLYRNGNGNGNGNGNATSNNNSNSNSSSNQQQSEETSDATNTTVIESTSQATIESVVSGTTELAVSAAPLDNVPASESVVKGRGRGRGRKVSA